MEVLQAFSHHFHVDIVHIVPIFSAALLEEALSLTAPCMAFTKSPYCGMTPAAYTRQRALLITLAHLIIAVPRAMLQPEEACWEPPWHKAAAKPRPQALVDPGEPCRPSPAVCMSGLRTAMRGGATNALFQSSCTEEELAELLEG